MTDVHRWLATATLALSALGAAWSLVLAVQSRPAGRAYFLAITLGTGAAVVTGLLGGLLLASGGGPDEPLHLVYGLVAFFALPIATLFAAGRPPRGQAVVMTVGWLIELGVVARLFQTG